MSWLAVLLLPLLPTPGGGAVISHDLHIAYADMAIEGAVVAGRIRIFKDDLERALGPMVGADAVSLRPGADADALVMGYLRNHLVIETLDENRAGERAGASERDRGRSTVLEPTLLQSGQDELDREPVWWMIVQYEAETPVSALRVRNTILFDAFDDQRNIMKFVRFPDETQKTFYFDEDEATHVVTY